MKKLLLLALIAFLPLWANAQKGISYQAVILDPNPIEIPGKDITGQPFVNGSVWVKFAILSGSTTQFQEVHQTTTDGYGLVNLTIGSVANTSFNALAWDSNQKSLQVYVSFNQGGTYTKVSDQKLSYLPYAFYTETAGKLSGILGITGGGTGAPTAVGARANLGLGNVDNTADVDKPVSNAALTALNLKVDKVAGERLINASEIAKLGDQSGVNTGDQDLSSLATKSSTDSAIALKAPLASPSFTGTVSGISKAMVGLGSVDNTTDVDKPVSTATQAALNLKLNVTGNAASATKLAASKNINGVAFDGSTDITVAADASTLSGTVAVANGGTGATTAAGARTNLGLEIGTHVQAPLTAGTDYLTPTGSAANLTSFPTFNQSTTGNAATATLADNISATTNTTLTSLANLATVGTITSGTISLTTDITTTGNLKAGEVTYPNAHGTNGQVLSTTGTGTLSWTSIPSPDLTNYVTTNTAQTITSAKTFSSSATATNNLALGTIFSPTLTAAANNNILVGVDINPTFTNGAFTPVANYGLRVQGIHIGRGGGNSSFNLAVGSSALLKNTAGNNNVAIGNNSLSQNTVGNNNTAIGNNTLSTNTVGDFNTAIGNTANVASNNLTNATALGYGAKVSASNTIQLGADGTFGTVAITNVKTTGSLTAGAVTYPNTHNSINGQVLITDEYGSASFGSIPSATNLAFPRNIYGGSFDGSADITNIIESTYGGTGNGFTKFSGPTGSEKTFTLPDADATILTSNTAVTVAQGGTGLTAAGNDGEVLTSSGGSLIWTTPATISIGTIAGTSDPNGGTINAGILNLTPADAANGGVVTTGQQQFSGGKIFVNNITANNVSLGMPSSGSQNTMLGEAAFGFASPGNNNTALGFMTLASLNNSGNEGNDNTAVGTNALRQGGTGEGSRNTAIGVNSMGNASGSYDNIAVGVNALNGATGDSNIAIGNYSLQNTTTARENVGVGFNSLLNSTDGGYNTAVGTNSMQQNTSGDVNTAIGHNSLVSNTIGRYNTAIGVQAQETNLTGNQNTAIGVAAIDRNTNGSNNVALGAFAGRYIGDGQTYSTEINNSVLIGSETKPLNNSSVNEIVIGYNATGNGSNTVQLGNANITNVNTSGSLTANASISSDITDNFTIDPSNAEAFKGKIIICNPSNAITITFSSSLPTGFNCMILQKSADANKITVAGGSGVTIKNRNNYTATAGNYALLTVVHIGDNILVTAGDMQ
jgi:hypothetical protein